MMLWFGLASSERADVMYAVKSAVCETLLLCGTKDFARKDADKCRKICHRILSKKIEPRRPARKTAHGTAVA